MTSTPLANGGTDQRYRELLHPILTDEERRRSEKIRAVLQLGADRLGVEHGHLTRIDPAAGTHQITEVSGPHPLVEQGAVIDLSKSFCRVVLAENEPLLLENAPEQGWADDPASEAFGFVTYLGTKVLANDQLYGTVCFVDQEGRNEAFTDADRALLEAIAQGIGREIERSRQGDTPQEVRRRLEQTERLLRRTQEVAQVGGWEYDPDRNLVDGTAQFFRLFGLPPHEALSLDDWLTHFPSTARDTVRAALRHGLSNGTPLDEEVPYRPDARVDDDRAAEDEHRWGRLRGHRVDGTDGNRLSGTFQDISDQKEKERELEESEARYRALAENFPDGAVGIYDQDLRYTLATGPLAGDVLPSAEEVKGNLVTDIFPDTTARDIEPLYRTAIEEGKLGSVETQFGGRDWKVWAVPLRDKHGEVFAGLSFAQDVTEQRRRERKLRLFRQLVEQANDAIVITEAAPLDEPGPRIEYVNPAFEEMTGYDADELLGRTPRILQGADTDRVVLKSLREALENGEAWEGETVNYQKDQRPYQLRWSVAPVRDEDGEIKRWMSIQRDVTEEREREGELRRQRNLLDQAQRLTGAWEANLQTGEVAWSDKVYEIYEMEPGSEIDLETGIEFYTPIVRAG